MKKSLKKITAIYILALSLVFSGNPVFAEGETEEPAAIQSESREEAPSSTQDVESGAPEESLEQETEAPSEETQPDETDPAEILPPEVGAEEQTEAESAAPETTEAETTAETTETESAAPETTEVESSAEESTEADTAAPETTEAETTAEESAEAESPAEESAEATEEAAETEESAEETAESEETEHDLTPVWHEEWIGKGEYYRLNSYEQAEIALYQVTSKVLFVREGKDSSAAVLGEVRKSSAVRVLSTEDPEWYFIETKDADGEILRGYASGRQLVLNEAAREKPEAVQIFTDVNTVFRDVMRSTYDELIFSEGEDSKRNELVNYALEFLGNPYVWGGTSLTNGTDCSGFAQGVYGHFGIRLPRCSYEQCNTGMRIRVDDARPGDLLFYANSNGIYHVMICYSNDGEGHIEVVHARDEKHGIVVSDANYARICWATTYEYFFGEATEEVLEWAEDADGLIEELPEEPAETPAPKKEPQTRTNNHPI